MNIKVGKAAKSVLNKAKANPGFTLAVLGLVFPGLMRKIAPVVIAATAKPEA